MTTTLTFPFGYLPDSDGVQGMGTMLTTEQLLERNTWKRMHPEFQRRLYCLMGFAAEHGHPLGVGTGWRIQPDDGRPGFTSPGNSNHEGFPDLHVVGDELNGDQDAVAADMVPNITWDWMEGQLAAFHLRSFRNVNNEPWHLQPIEIPASRSRGLDGVLLPAPRRLRWTLASPALPWPAPPPPPPVDPPAALLEEDEMVDYVRVYRGDGSYTVFRRSGQTLVWLSRAQINAEKASLAAAGQVVPKETSSAANVTDLLASYVLVGKLPPEWPPVTAFAGYIPAATTPASV